MPGLLGSRVGGQMRPASPQPFRRYCALLLIKVDANLFRNVSLRLSVPLVGERMGQADLLRESRRIQFQKGLMLMGLEKMLGYLHGYMNQGMAKLLEKGFLWGFKIPLVVQDFSFVHKNLCLAREHLEVVCERLLTEVKLGGC